MDVKLIVLGGKNAGRAIPITAEKFFIGRAEDCHLRPNSDLVSRHHCAITVDDDEVTVRDFGSRNGTLVNGERIRGEEELKSGDRLVVGPLEFEVRVEVALAAPKKPKVQSVEEAAARTVQAASAKPTDGGELDIADWLADTVDGGGDTKAIEKVKSETAVTGGTAATEDDADSKEPDPEKDQEAEKKKETRPKSASGIHGLKKPKAIDTKSAAADTLRAIFNRK